MAANEYGAAFPRVCVWGGGGGGEGGEGALPRRKAPTKKRYLFQAPGIWKGRQFICLSI